jgi:primosomal protein N' (replication factor Y)
VDHRVVAVALPLPLLTPFSYRVPGDGPLPEPGVRVVVPFGARRVVGIVTGPGEETLVPLKDVLEVVDSAPLPSAPLLALAAWIADHYIAPPGEAYRLLFPPEGASTSRSVVRLLDASRAAGDPLLEALQGGPLSVPTLTRRLGADPRNRLARLRKEGLITVDQELARGGFRSVQMARVVRDGPGRGPAQEEVLARLKSADGRARVRDVVRDRPSLRRALVALSKAGIVAISKEVEGRAPRALSPVEAPPVALTADQTKALRPIETAIAEGRFETFLLRGVTGSGKTEVYLRATAHALDSGRSALILVPEIALTPFLVRAAAQRFGRRVSLLHSELSAGERHDEWWRIHEGDARVVVGARSAVFAPVAELGLVVVDEEHESSYKQEESPRYHARNVAVMRAQLEGAVAVLGSATPSVESSLNTQKGKYTLLVMPARIRERPLPTVEIVDRRSVLRSGGDPILTPPLLEALGARLARGEQSLLLLNRRGYATSLLCRECGEQALCPNCSVSLTLHRGGRIALCHYCGHRAETPPACSHCGGEYLRLTGYGTEKVSEAVEAAFPRARVDRLDRDRASRRGELERVLLAFEGGRTDILVGTQMIAKGHDFPRVTLVGVVDADVGLGIPDFRAAEKTFQLLTQVAGRAGRGDVVGEVIFQSHLPDHYALQSACAQDYPTFFGREMEFRRTMGYPPTAALLNLIFRSADAARAERDADGVAQALRQVPAGRFRVLGPARAPLARLKGEHRYQVLLKGDRASMGKAVREALTARFGVLRWPGVVVDVDPVNVL